MKNKLIQLAQKLINTINISMQLDDNFDKERYISLLLKLEWIICKEKIIINEDNVEVLNDRD